VNPRSLAKATIRDSTSCHAQHGVRTLIALSVLLSSERRDGSYQGMRICHIVKQRMESTVVKAE
jgi:hypothetical protein